jgi:hypothetical protein
MTYHKDIEKFLNKLRSVGIVINTEKNLHRLDGEAVYGLAWLEDKIIQIEEEVLKNRDIGLFVLAHEASHIVSSGHYLDWWERYTESEEVICDGVAMLILDDLGGSIKNVVNKGVLVEEMEYDDIKIVLMEATYKVLKEWLE